MCIKRWSLTGGRGQSTLQPWASLTVFIVWKTCTSQPSIRALISIGEEGAGYRAAPGLSPRWQIRRESCPGARSAWRHLQPNEEWSWGQTSGDLTGFPP